MADRLEDVKPTRMELLRIKKRKLLAETGHDLLSEKKDALINEFFKVIDRRRELRNELQQILAPGYKTLIQAEMLMGKGEIKSIAEGAMKMGGVDIDADNIMGVKVPVLNATIPGDRFYGFVDTSVKLDESLTYFREALDTSIALAEVEGKLDRLAEEIEKAKRRVNALEYIYIPRLEATIKYIERQIDEREREDFFRRKKIKALMERKNEM